MPAFHLGPKAPYQAIIIKYEVMHVLGPQTDVCLDTLHMIGLARSQSSTILSLVSQAFVAPMPTQPLRQSHTVIGSICHEDTHAFERIQLDPTVQCHGKAATLGCKSDSISSCPRLSFNYADP
jgi:hypothetical protein